MPNSVKNAVKRPAKNIGVFGGTFDPIHMGHITPLLQAIKQLKLQQVHITPANIPPHKQHTYAENHHRIAMVKQVCEQYPEFVFDERELKREKLSYTVDTLKEIHAENPQLENLCFFAGMDSLLTFNTWYQWQEILSLCYLIISPRPDYQLENLPKALAPFITVFTSKHRNFDSTKRIIIMPPCLHQISSTQLRKKILEKQSIKSLVPAYVDNYIQHHQLYQ